MQLSAFITSHRDQILDAWEEGALRRVLPSREANFAALKDQLGELLDTLARDLDHAGSAELTIWDHAKTHGPQSVEAVGEKHGVQRAAQGLTVEHVISEFPILRSCVVRLWRESMPAAASADLESLIRLDDAIDRALMESVSGFMKRLDHSRRMFLGMLGHDLRDPLATIISGGKLLLEDEPDKATMLDIVGRMVSTGERMHRLVVDLLDFTRARLIGRMPITRRDIDLAETVRHVVEEFTTSHPDRTVNLRMSGNLRGLWDEERLSQAVGNLVANALKHGAAHAPIDVSTAADHEVTIAVHNEGPPIPEDQRAGLFEPLGVVSQPEATGKDSDRLRLGLYITKEIVAGHGGSIDLDSSADRGTTFTIHLPRRSEGGERPATNSANAA
jgi:signal transduction histidine kinase